MIRIKIPATTANLGPGFDCMGLALDLWNTFELHLGEPGTGAVVEVQGEGSKTLPKDNKNLVARIFESTLGSDAPFNYRIICRNEIPCASGLGSSSTATIAGLLLAKAWKRKQAGLDPADIDVREILADSVTFEGHGDNVAPAILGGFVIVVPEDDGVVTQRVPHVPVRAVVCVPEFEYLTVDARAALPSTYSKADAIFNIGRAMLVAEALRFGDKDLLKRAMSDRIHEPYRMKAIPGAIESKAAALNAGAICVTLSGAGPGLFAIAEDRFDQIGNAMKAAFEDAGLTSRYWVLGATAEGLKINRLPV